MYFKFFKPKSWDKRFAECRRLFIQSFPNERQTFFMESYVPLWAILPIDVQAPIHTPKANNTPFSVKTSITAKFGDVNVPCPLFACIFRFMELFII